MFTELVELEPVGGLPLAVAVASLASPSFVVFDDCVPLFEAA